MTQHTGEAKEVCSLNDLPEAPDGDRGEVNDGQGRVLPPRSHDITGQRVVSKLLLTVQERVAKEVNVSVVAVSRSRVTYHTCTLVY